MGRIPDELLDEERHSKLLEAGTARLDGAHSGAPGFVRFRDWAVHNYVYSLLVLNSMLNKYIEFVSD